MRKLILYFLLCLSVPYQVVWGQEHMHEHVADEGEVIQLSGLKPGKYLMYETMDVIFYLPYGKAVEALLQSPEEQKIFAEEPGEWSWMRWPAYMAQWTHAKSLLQTIDHVKATEYPDFGPVVYMVLPNFLKQGKVTIYDKAAGEFLGQVHWESYAEDYQCDCHGNPVQGTIQHDRFYARTAQTAYLYFYMQQSNMRPTCCMEEFPLPEASAVE